MCFIVPGGLEGKYRVAAPELMQDTFMSDSEDEGGKKSSYTVSPPLRKIISLAWLASNDFMLNNSKFGFLANN